MHGIIGKRKDLETLGRFDHPNIGLQSNNAISQISDEQEILSSIGIFIMYFIL